ncbi:uncharacterized protein LOC120347875 isoform X2 [Styela clava]
MEPAEKKRKTSTYSEQKTPNYGKKVLEVLDDFRKAEDLCDFFLKVGDRVVPVHQNVIAATSPYLKDLIDRGTGGTSIVEIPNASFTAVKRCVEYLYSGTTRVTLEDAGDILDVASLMQLQDMVELWFKHFADILNVRNCWEIKHLADKHNNKKIKKSLDSLISNNIGDVCYHVDFVAIGIDELIRYISKANDVVSAWKAASLWVTSDLITRSDNLHLIIKNLHLDRLKIDDIEMLLNDTLIKSSNPCIEEVAKKVLKKVKEEKFTINNWPTLNLAAEVINDTALTTLVHQKMCVMLVELSDKKEFLKIPLQEMKFILNSVHIDKESESDVWNAISRWISYDPYRHKCCFEILKSVNLKKFSVELINDVIRDNKIVDASKDCRNLILDALVAHASTSKETSKSSKSSKPAKPVIQTASSSNKSFCSSSSGSFQAPGQMSSKIKNTSTKSSSASSKPSNIIAVLDNRWDSILAFDPKNASCRQMWNIPLDKQSTMKNASWFQAAAMGSIIFVMCDKSFFSFDTKNNTWKSLTSPLHRHDEHSKAIGFQSKLCVIGQNSEFYEPLKDEWTVAPLPDLLTIKFCVASTPTKLYKIGGTLKTQATGWVYIWESEFKNANHTRMIQPRKCASAATSQEDLYVMGGINATDGILSSTESYSPKTDTWCMLSDVRCPVSFSSSCCLQGDIYYFGGNTIEKYEKKKHTWNVVKKMDAMGNKFAAIGITSQ